MCRWKWAPSLRLEIPSPAQTLWSWFRIQLEAWMSVCDGVFVLSCVSSGLATGLITRLTRPTNSVRSVVPDYWIWCETGQRAWEQREVNVTTLYEAHIEPDLYFKKLHTLQNTVAHPTVQTPSMNTIRLKHLLSRWMFNRIQGICFFWPRAVRCMVLCQ
jgi:hypothetical protein